ncbi:hypothetical protein WJX81_004039 [Elliptochloris bilobata]|uniref:CBM1 domain-containing protein n=1 Tax=Elliptochloris bilobata TaxID=381761 RepID=A0AAW1RNQ8_9CHLO
MVLYVIGLGLYDEKDITIRGLEAVKQCSRVYLEAYTSVLMVPKERLESFYGKEVVVADREMVESEADRILDAADSVDVAFLVVGDPFGATTHTDLQLRARALGIEVRVVHNASIISAVGACGLQLYRYGEAVSIVFFTETWRPRSFYPRIAANRRAGLHTLCLLDIKIREPSLESLARGRKVYEPARYMTVAQAVSQLLEVEEAEGGGAYGPDTLAVGVARLGSPDQQVVAAPLAQLADVDFGPPLHSLILAGDTHHLHQASACQRQSTRRCRARRHSHTLAASVVEDPSSTEAPQQEAGTREGLRLTEERLPNSRVRVTVEVPAADVRTSYQRVLQQSRKKLEIPGFRKGKKVPDSVLIRHLGGQAEANSAAIEYLLKATVPAALSRFADTAVSDSEKIEDDKDELLARFSLDAPLMYNVTLDVMPPVAWKQPYTGIKVELPSAGDKATAAAAVEKRLAIALREKGKLRIVLGRPLRRGDVAIMDFAVTRTDRPGGAEPVLGSQKRGMQLDTANAEDTINIPGIVAGMEGMVVGDERSIDSAFPQNWHEPQSLRGVPCRCDIKVNELFEWDLPELDNEFAETLYPGCGGLEKLRGIMEAAEMRILDSQTKQKVHEALTAALAERVDAEVPQSVLRELGSQEYQAKLLEAQARGKLSFEAVQQLATEELLEKYIESRQDDLADIQRATMGIDAIYAAEGLQVPEAEVEAEFSSAASEFRASQQDFDEARLREQVVEALKAAVTLEWLERHSEVGEGDRPDVQVKKAWMAWCAARLNHKCWGRAALLALLLSLKAHQGAATGAALWAQCGGLGSAPSAAEAADAPWTSAACPDSCTCKRVNAYYYQCTPFAPPPPRADHGSAIDAPWPTGACGAGGTCLRQSADFWRCVPGGGWDWGGGRGPSHARPQAHGALASVLGSGTGTLALYDQCGGRSNAPDLARDDTWEGYQCPAGTACSRHSEWFWQCLPASKPPPPPPPLPPIVDPLNVLAAYDQCGGISGAPTVALALDQAWAGSSCPAGTQCARQSQYYWQCLPASPPPPPPPGSAGQCGGTAGAPTPAAALDAPWPGQICTATQLGDRSVISGACCHMAAGTVCKVAGGRCRNAAVCDGVSPDCPVRTWKAYGEACEALEGACVSGAETCSGLSPYCPRVAVISAHGQVCLAAATPCQLPSVCDGTNRDCPDAALAPAGTACGPACLCDGVSEGCPAGFYLAPGDAATCAACPAGCALCAEPLGLCSQCSPGYQLIATTATCQPQAGAVPQAAVPTLPPAQPSANAAPAAPALSRARNGGGGGAGGGAAGTAASGASATASTSSAAGGAAGGGGGGGGSGLAQQPVRGAGGGGNAAAAAAAAASAAANAATAASTAASSIGTAGAASAASSAASSARAAAAAASTAVASGAVATGTATAAASAATASAAAAAVNGNSTAASAAAAAASSHANAAASYSASVTSTTTITTTSSVAATATAVASAANASALAAAAAAAAGSAGSAGVFAAATAAAEQAAAAARAALAVGNYAAASYAAAAAQAASQAAAMARGGDFMGAATAAGQAGDF